jgi:chaperonin cofactor prefoldin
VQGRLDGSAVVPLESDASAVKFKFFSDESKAIPPQRAPDGVAASLQSEPLPKNPSDDLPCETSSTEFDPLSLFLPEDPAAGTGSTRALTSESHHTSRHVPALGVREISTASCGDSTALDDLRALLRQTEIALEVVRDLTNNTDDRLASLRQLAEEVMHRAAAFQAQKESIDRGLVEATRVTELLAALDARVTTLTGTNQVLGHAEATVGQLERRAAETAADLERRVNEFDAQKRTIDGALVEATRVTNIVAALDARVATLAGKGDVLGRADAAVGQLERRVAQAAVRLEQAAKTKGQLEHELANIQKQLQALTGSARNTVAMLAKQQREIHQVMSTSRSPTAAEPHASAGATSRGAQKTGQPVPRWAVVLGALAVLTLLALIVMRSRDQPIQIARTARAAQRESPSSASALPSRTLGSATFAIPAHRPAGRIAMPPANQAASDARPTRGPVQTPRTTEPSRRTGSANDTAQEFTGVLVVASVPTGAAVFIDQKQVGTTPLELTRLRAASHVIRIEHAGYERWTTALLVPADKQTRVSANLQPVRD